MDCSSDFYLDRSTELCGLLDGSNDRVSIGSLDGVVLGLLDGSLDGMSLGLLDGVSIRLLTELI